MPFSLLLRILRTAISLLYSKSSTLSRASCRSIGGCRSLRSASTNDAKIFCGFRRRLCHLYLPARTVLDSAIAISFPIVSSSFLNLKKAKSEKIDHLESIVSTSLPLLPDKQQMTMSRTTSSILATLLLAAATSSAFTVVAPKASGGSSPALHMKFMKDLGFEKPSWMPNFGGEKEKDESAEVPATDATLTAAAAEGTAETAKEN